MAQTFALIAPVQPVLHRVSCCNKILQNAPKHYDLHQNMSLGFNGVDGVSYCEKFWCNFVERTFALIALVQPVLHRALCSNQTIQNGPKHYETHQYMSLGFNRVDCVRCKKFRCDFILRTCALIAPVQPVLHRVSCSNKILPNTPKHYETHTNMSLGSNGVDWVRSLRKIPKRLNGTNLCINCTSSTRCAPSFMY